MRTRSRNYTSAGGSARNRASNAKGKKKNATSKKPASTSAARVTKPKTPAKATTKSPAPSAPAIMRRMAPKNNGSSSRTFQLQQVLEHSVNQIMADYDSESDSSSEDEDDSEVEEEDDGRDSRMALAPTADNRPLLSEWWDDLLKDVPRDAQCTMRTHKLPWKGFARLFGHVAECLRKGKLPTTDNVLPLAEADWPNESRSFLDGGGTVASVVLACFEGVFDQSAELGDGTHDATFRQDMARIRACRNDTQHTIARKGYKHFEGVESMKWWRDTMSRG